MFTVYSENKDQVLLVRQYRYPIDNIFMNFRQGACGRRRVIMATVP